VSHALRHLHHALRVQPVSGGRNGSSGVEPLLADRGHHRAPAAPLLIAATAELAGLAVLHHEQLATSCACRGQELLTAR
jgi:hypothetical protein